MSPTRKKFQGGLRIEAAGCPDLPLWLGHGGGWAEPETPSHPAEEQKGTGVSLNTYKKGYIWRKRQWVPEGGVIGRRKQMSARTFLAFLCQVVPQVPEQDEMGSHEFTGSGYDAQALSLALLVSYPL